MTAGKRPKLITFDGEARSGKGTIAHFVKRTLQTRGMKVMLIDRGQAFRGLVVSATKNKVEINDPAALDIFLSNNDALESTVQLLKDIYHMSHAERDAILYTKLIGESSAKIGARPLSQVFVHDLTIKWLSDAKAETYDVVLMDGRALEEIAVEAEASDLVDYPLGMYFICDSVTGAMRTLGYASKAYGDLDSAEKTEVDTFVKQITERNRADKTRDVQTLTRPAGAKILVLPDIAASPRTGRQMYIIDTGADMTKEAMCEPMMRLVDAAL